MTDNEASQSDVARAANILTDSEFKELEISDFLKANLTNEMHLKYMTHVQQKAIPVMLRGKDVAVRAKTGSGKTLAFLLPALNLIYASHMKPKNGLGVLVLSPTRELAMQTYAVCKRLIGSTNSVKAGLAIGGTNRAVESETIAKGVNLLIGTPGRVKDHLENCPGFITKNCFMIILDEADQLLSNGFEEELSAIFRILPNKDTRKIALFSATLDDRVTNIRDMNLQKDHVRIDITAEQSKDGTAEGRIATHINLQQGYVVCPVEARLMLLYTFLKKMSTKKIMVFFSSCASVDFHSQFFARVKANVIAITGQMKQMARTKAFQEFTNAESGALFCTDVAARGLDIPDVDVVIQFDPPESVESYIHRVGRVCRGDSTTKGMGVLFLMEHEVGFVRLLRNASIEMNEYEFPKNKLINVQAETEHIISSLAYLYQAAVQAFRSFLLAYVNQPLKQIFNVHSIDMEKLAKSFGLASPPQVNQQLILKEKKAPKGSKHHLHRK